MKETRPIDDLLRGVWRENPVLVQILGLCPTLAVTRDQMSVFLQRVFAFALP